MGPQSSYPSVRLEPSCTPSATDPSTGCAFRSEAISSSTSKGDDVTLLDGCPYLLFSELPQICAILQLKASQLIHSEGRYYWGWIKERALFSTDFYSFHVAEVLRYEKGNTALVFCYRKQLTTQSLAELLDSKGIWINSFHLLVTIITGITLFHLALKTIHFAVLLSNPLPTRRCLCANGGSRPSFQHWELHHPTVRPAGRCKRKPNPSLFCCTCPIQVQPKLMALKIKSPIWNSTWVAALKTAKLTLQLDQEQKHPFFLLFWVVLASRASCQDAHRALGTVALHQNHANQWSGYLKNNVNAEGAHKVCCCAGRATAVPTASRTPSVPFQEQVN